MRSAAVRSLRSAEARLVLNTAPLASHHLPPVPRPRTYAARWQPADQVSTGCNCSPSTPAASPAVLAIASGPTAAQDQRTADPGCTAVRRRREWERTAVASEDCGSAETPPG